MLSAQPSKRQPQALTVVLIRTSGSMANHKLVYWSHIFDKICFLYKKKRRHTLAHSFLTTEYKSKSRSYPRACHRVILNLGNWRRLSSASRPRPQRWTESWVGAGTGLGIFGPAENLTTIPRTTHFCKQPTGIKLCRRHEASGNLTQSTRGERWATLSVLFLRHKMLQLFRIPSSCL